MSYNWTKADTAEARERLKALLMDDEETVFVRFRHGSEELPHGFCGIWDFAHDLGPDRHIDEVLDEELVEFLDPNPVLQAPD